MNILVLNCGSSSLKFQIIETDLEKIEKNADVRHAKGLIERIGGDALVTLQSGNDQPIKETIPLPDHHAALNHVARWIVSLREIQAIGHRVVHGGEKFQTSVLIDDEVIHGIEECIELAPLHNPPNLKGIQAAQKYFGPAIPQVAVFDTSFHSTMPEVSYLYALPYDMYRQNKVRRYGFHGTSHRYVSYRYGLIAHKKKEDINIITLHLGNGCSACAIRNGKSLDTSMGLTPLEGLVMGTRSGDIDPGIVQYLADKTGMNTSEIDSMLNKKSGLLGVSGLTNDMRDLIEKENENPRAKLAIDLFCQRIQKYIGSYLAEMNGADAIVFTGGIGENSPIIRQRISSNLNWFGIELDETRNNSVGNKEGEISTPSSRVKLFVIPTNEELLIARDTVRTIAAK
jgi:acetate kinase